MSTQLSAGDYAELIEAVSRGADDSGKDQRRAPRVPHRARIEIVPYDAQGPKSAMIVSVKNFSPRGIGLSSPAAMHRGRVFVARLPRGNGFVGLLYTVVHCNTLGTRLHEIGAELTCVLRPDSSPVGSAQQVDHIRDSILD